MDKFKSLKSKISINVVAIILLISIANLITGFYTGYLSITKNVEDNVKALGETAIKLIDKSLSSMMDNITAIAGSNYISSSANKTDLFSNLNKDKDKYGYTAIYLVDSNGKIVSDNTKINGQSLNADLFAQMKDKDSYLSNVIIEDPENPVVYFAAKVNNGNYNGYVVAETDPLIYSSIIKEIVIGKTGNVFIINEEGVVLANVRDQLVQTAYNLNNNAGLKNIAAKMVNGQAGIEIYKYDGVSRICFYGQLSSIAGWSVGAAAPINEMTQTLSYTIIGLAISTLIFLVLGILVTFQLANRISKPILVVSDRLKKLSEGDLSSDTIDVKSKDETGILASSLNTTVLNLRKYINVITNVLHELSDGNMVCKIDEEFEGDFSPIKDSLVKIIESLNSVLKDIRKVANNVTDSAEQTAASALQLADSSTKQAGVVEELSATLYNVSNQTDENSKNADRANLITNSTKEIAIKGNKEMEEMIQAINEINIASENISSIIKVIDNIAFQTNILALNAAVEAARAGQAGKGFAVVADEVRSLATKTSESAKETTTYIEDTLIKVEQGTKKANNAADALREIVKSIEECVSVVGSIAESSKLQSNSLSEINAGVTQFSDSIQTNTAMSEESSATSIEMKTQSNTLKEKISKFRLE